MSKTEHELNINEALAKAKNFLQDDTKCSEEARAVFSPILMILEALLAKLGKNSQNSSIPPSQDQNREKTLQSPSQEKKKPGGQPGRAGKNLAQFEKVDEVIDVPVDRTNLPPVHEYIAVGHEARQVVELIVRRWVKEYRLEIVQDENGKRYTAKAPEGVNSTVQYGTSVKTQSAYMYAFQMIPYGRIENYFRDQAGILISSGTIFNFNREAFELLDNFEATAKVHLRGAVVLNADETGINISGKRHWLHNASNDKWTLYHAHKKRGREAINDMGILPYFSGVLVHDHWSPYYTYQKCQHSLCNAHHLRELQWITDKFPTRTWALLMQDFLKALNVAADKAGGALDEKAQKEQIAHYRQILAVADSESPPHSSPEAKKRGKVKHSKERNLIERLRKFEGDVLRFMTNKEVPFTNNQAERDIRMVKVQQKISGCFRSEDGAKIFCRMRSYILTCQKHLISSIDALVMLFHGRLPDFCAT